MVRERARSPFVWVRRLLLLLGLLGVATLGVMLGAYRFAKPEDPTSRRPRQNLADANTIESGEGLDHTQTSEGHPVFRIRAEKSRQQRDNTAYLEGVLLDIFRPDGGVYAIRSDTAVFNQPAGKAKLAGNVVLKGWGDLEVLTRDLELEQNGQLLTSTGEVEFRYPPYLRGRASSLQVDRPQELIVLSGGVHLHSVPGAPNDIRLDCERLAYRRPEGIVRALDDVVLQAGDHEVRGRALTVFLQEDQRTVKSFRARWDVSGSLAQVDAAGFESRVTYRAEHLEVETDPTGATVQTIRLESDGGDDSVFRGVVPADSGHLGPAARGPAELQVSDPSGLVRYLSGRTLIAYLQAGQLVQVEGNGNPAIGLPLVLREELALNPPFLLRQACAGRGTARFLANGDLARVDLQEGVEIKDQETMITGSSQAVLDFASEELRAEGPAVELFNERGQVVAPRFSYSLKNGRIRAEGGVRTTVAPTSVALLDETPLAQGTGPVRIESNVALWTLDPPSSSFRGKVRAWRGQNLLLADQLRGNETARTMAASGAVKTVWFSPPPSAPAGAVKVDDPGQPIEVTSQQLTYRRAENRLLYEGEVQVVQGQRTLACQKLTVTLAPGGGAAERMTCQDKVRLVDPQGRRQVLGDTAIYQLAEDHVEIFGKPVQLLDADDNKLEGRYLLYDVAAGTVQLKSQAPAGKIRP